MVKVVNGNGKSGKSKSFHPFVYYNSKNMQNIFVEITNRRYFFYRGICKISRMTRKMMNILASLIFLWFRKSIIFNTFISLANLKYVHEVKKNLNSLNSFHAIADAKKQFWEQRVFAAEFSFSLDVCLGYPFEAIKHVFLEYPPRAVVCGVQLRRLKTASSKFALRSETLGSYSWKLKSLY